MGKNNFISIVIPLYNSESYIEATLQSLIGQTYQDFEVIIVDDKSTDKSISVVQAFLAKHPNLNAQLLTERPQDFPKGVSGSRNYGISIAKGEWVCFLDSDDLFHQSKLEILYNIIQEQNNATKAIHHQLLEFNDGEPVTFQAIPTAWNATYDPSIEQLVNLNTIATSAVTVKKEIFQQTGYFDTGLGGVEDYYLWLHVALYTNWLFIPLKLTGYRVRIGSLMGGRKFQHYIEQNSRLDRKMSKNNLFSSGQKSRVRKYFMFDVMQYYAIISINQYGWGNFISGLGKLISKGYYNYAIRIGLKHAKFVAFQKLSLLKSFTK